MRILVIDDDVELADLLRTFLRREGFQPEIVHEGRAGLERALAGGYDLIVLDVMLPGMDGFEILKRLREQSRVPVVMLTARGDGSDRIVGLERIAGGWERTHVVLPARVVPDNSSRAVAVVLRLCSLPHQPRARVAARRGLLRTRRLLGSRSRQPR